MSVSSGRVSTVGVDGAAPASPRGFDLPNGALSPPNVGTLLSA